MVDKSLHFGLQNFLFITQDDTGLVYCYCAYQDRKGVTVIGRFKKDDTEALYYCAAGTFASIWAGRVGYTYVLPSALADPSV